ncbi:MAG: CDGSH iron-sulfur domain-containing protein [Euryarchaeota archaeon]|nr:CDGSH iron-sulfur domain-containing protein [Euryarchaeota archaeon]MDE1836471.1 CDGSH iron-sulfur domain-containing protein [Euryarchaeota archaeon]MDE1880638.1 CDGSH iron-sulfur domain-containing protein [Euryarchaeota archaeon]MDE2044219.1 CDGSH iron-sulfur domain-containing protein [Thermoplasmata archaeon]
MKCLVRHDATGPAVLQVRGQAVAVCQCGLSKNKRFWDDSHARTRDEKRGRIYLDDSMGNRLTLEDMFPTPAKKFEVAKRETPSGPAIPP